ncbi:MAG: KpsF/GutQ family sugar-phosphate isomerase [Bacteriovoracaceae bacterium]|nr:KpsF/GutQ family sugar-phosphate isomerase [Bacteriovoracaceae bacterium]
MENSNSQIFKDVLRLEAKAIEDSIDKITEGQINKLSEIYDRLAISGGSLVFCGVGKSGMIANKLASTFSSLGLPSWFLHPVEALHGDLGRLMSKDALVLISKSGGTEEILKLAPFLKTDKESIIGLLGQVNSKIGELCGLIFNCEVAKEACINNQAPTTSSTLALAMGDAMAVFYEDYVKLSKENFAINHPGGLLGKVLKLQVKDVMTSAVNCPTLNEEQLLKDAILAMTQYPLGGCAICNNDLMLLGIIVEGDIRRTFSKDKNEGLETKIKEVMNDTPLFVSPDSLAIEALRMMENRKSEIQILPVVNKDNIFQGFVRLHDLLKEGFKS